MVSPPTDALVAQVSLSPAPSQQLIVVVCVSKHDDCGRQLCLLSGGGRNPGLGGQPVWCWRCLQRDLNLSQGELQGEVSSRFSTLLSRVHTEFGLAVTFPAVYPGMATAPEAHRFERDSVVETVEVGYPTFVKQDGQVRLPPLKVGWFSDDGLWSAARATARATKAQHLMRLVRCVQHGRQCKGSLGEWGTVTINHLPSGRITLVNWWSRLVDAGNEEGGRYSGERAGHG